MKLKFQCLVAALFLLSSASQAASVTQDVEIQATDPGSVAYLAFTVTTAGNFNIWGLGEETLGVLYNEDPMLHLFQNSIRLGNWQASDDDSGADLNNSIHSDALIAQYLNKGNYFVAASESDFTVDAAISGNNAFSVYPNDRPSKIRIKIDSDDGVAEIVPVPLPAAFWLFASALVGVISRRRQV